MWKPLRLWPLLRSAVAAPLTNPKRFTPTSEVHPHPPFDFARSLPADFADIRSLYERFMQTQEAPPAPKFEILIEIRSLYQTLYQHEMFASEVCACFRSLYQEGLYQHQKFASEVSANISNLCQHQRPMPWLRLGIMSWMCACAYEHTCAHMHALKVAPSQWGRMVSAPHVHVPTHAHLFTACAPVPVCLNVHVCASAQLCSLLVNPCNAELPCAFSESLP